MKYTAEYRQNEKRKKKWKTLRSHRKNYSNLRRKLFSVKREFSIVADVFSSSHRAKFTLRRKEKKKSRKNEEKRWEIFFISSHSYDNFFQFSAQEHDVKCLIKLCEVKLLLFYDLNWIDNFLTFLRRLVDFSTSKTEKFTQLEENQIKVHEPTRNKFLIREQNCVWKCLVSFTLRVFGFEVSYKKQQRLKWMMNVFSRWGCWMGGRNSDAFELETIKNF